MKRAFATSAECRFEQTKHDARISVGLMCMHVQCVAGAGDYSAGVAGVVPPIAPTPELKEVKGICDVCRMPVLADQARCKNQRGAYVHAQCAAAAGAQVLYGNNIQAAAKVAPRSGHDRVTV